MEENPNIIVKIVKNEYSKNVFSIVATNAKTAEKIGFVRLSDKGDGLLHIDSVQVEEKFRNKGIAKAMYQFIEKHCKGYKVLSANVASELSMALHESEGFENKSGTTLESGMVNYEKRLHGFMREGFPRKDHPLVISQKNSREQAADEAYSPEKN